MTADNPYQAILLQPPPGDLTGPYPALCYLKSYAARQGYHALVKDLGIEALHYLLRPERICGMLERVRRQCNRLETAPALDAEKQEQYGRLLARLPAHDDPEWFAQSIQMFRQDDACRHRGVVCRRQDAECRHQDGTFRFQDAAFRRRGNHFQVAESHRAAKRNEARAVRWSWCPMHDVR